MEVCSVYCVLNSGSLICYKKDSTVCAGMGQLACCIGILNHNSYNKSCMTHKTALEFLSSRVLKLSRDY